MDEIEDLLKKIRDAWNYYFWEYKYCQNKIRFDAEIKTNYYNDIFHYINVTLTSLTKIKYEKEPGKSFFQTVGILQIIYTHQDLIDEILHIFKLGESIKADKNPNREIRNELIGHPIRRKKKPNELISTVFLGWGSSNGSVDYTLYAKENNFSGKAVQHQLDDIIVRHKSFLRKYTGIIWKRIGKILRLLQKELIELDVLVNKNVDFNKLVTLTEQRYEKVLKENHLFKREILLKCYDRRNEHLRYKNVVRLFLETLKEYLPEAIKNIDEFLSIKEDKFQEATGIKIEYLPNTDSENEVTRGRNTHIDYEFSKLFEQHPIYGVEYFKKKFKDEADIMNELTNMENNLSNILEYFSSYEHLRNLLIDKGVLTE